MFNYRLTALLLPAFLLLAFPALSAHSWPYLPGNGLTLPFLTLLSILYCALRYPGLLCSPMVFISGLACDLFTHSPPGFWALLFLTTLALARSINKLVERRGHLLGYWCFGLTVMLINALTWSLISFYHGHWNNPINSIEAMIMALALLPIPALLFISLEKILILKNDQLNSGYPGHFASRS